jgi:hypothetical protein
MKEKSVVSPIGYQLNVFTKLAQVYKKIINTCNLCIKKGNHLDCLSYLETIFYT